MAGDIRLGIMVSSVNTVVENWYPKIVPDGVSVHFVRMLIADGSSPKANLRRHGSRYGSGHAATAQLDRDQRDETEERREDKVIAR
jgi:maleate cis-trans isomerase